MFHDALPILLDALAQGELFAPAWSALTIIVVRDPHGRLRLIFDERGCAANPLGLDAVAALEQSLTRALRGWFMPPVLATHSAPPLAQRLAAELVKLPLDPWPQSWPAELADGQPLPQDRLRTLQRFHGNQSWLIALSEQPGAKPPWPIESGPSILAFYSFKGGVGRTTTLALMADRFARAGRKVACIDLDLEAPGLGELMGLDTSDAIQFGVVDALLERAVGDDLPAALEDWWHHVELEDGVALRVLPAGRLDAMYLDKLARLDLSTQTGPSMVQRALHDLLVRTRGKQQLGPQDVILLDCRAGLHELAGIALKHLAHVQILVSRNTRQNIAGLELALRALSPRLLDEARCLLLQTFIPIKDLDAERDAFRLQAHRALTAALAPHDAPDLDDEQAIHQALPILYTADLSAAATLQEIPGFVRDQDTYAAIFTRLEELMR